jgi:hypothetical protein
MITLAAPTCYEIDEYRYLPVCALEAMDRVGRYFGEVKNSEFKAINTPVTSPIKIFPKSIQGISKIAVIPAMKPICTRFVIINPVLSAKRTPVSPEFLLHLTKNIPIMEANTPAEQIHKGNATPRIPKVEYPSKALAIMDPLNDPFKSAPIPAISPTLSPTLSAMVPGFLGSSSGIPVSTFPTRSKDYE